MICYLSEKGHNNFYYASSTRAILDDSAQYIKLPWVGGHNRDLIPIKVEKKFITPLTVDKNCVNNIIDNKNNYIVVWITKVL